MFMHGHTIVTFSLISASIFGLGKSTAGVAPERIASACLRFFRTQQLRIASKLNRIFPKSIFDTASLSNGGFA